VTRVIHHVEQHAGGEAKRQVLDQRAASVPAAAGSGGEGLRIGRRRLDIGVTAEYPETLTARGMHRGRVKPHRRLASQEREDVVRKAARKPVQIGEIDVTGGHRCQCRSSAAFIPSPYPFFILSRPTFVIEFMIQVGRTGGIQ
jgi:hypothetical protein